MFKRKSKDTQISQTHTGDLPHTHEDRLYALARKLGQRVTELESITSTLRRDLNRVDRKVYRADELPPSKVEKEAEIILSDPYAGRL